MFVMQEGKGSGAEFLHVTGFGESSTFSKLNQILICLPPTPLNSSFESNSSFFIIHGIINGNNAWNIFCIESQSADMYDS